MGFSARTSFILLLILLVLAICPAHPAAAPTWYRVLEKNSSRLLVELTAPAPQIDTVMVQGRPFTVVQAAGWPLLPPPREPLPFQTLLLEWPVESVSVRVAAAAPEQRRRIAPLQSACDWPLPGSPKLFAEGEEEVSDGAAPAAAALVEALFTGAAAGAPLWQLRFLPFRHDARTGELVWTTSVRVELTPGRMRNDATALPPLQGASELAITGAAGLSRASAAAGEVTAPGRVKMLIDAEGWYRVSGADLRRAGLDLLQVDVARLRLICAGQEVPFYFDGGTDRQMGPEESIQFYATGRHRTFQVQSPDLYQDPFSPTEAYWLSWDESAGARMAEEVSESTGGAVVQKPWSFYQTVHVEQDQFFHHLGDISASDSLRDHWLYDGGIGAGEKRSYSFSLLHPDLRSALPVRLRVMLTGLTIENSEPHQTAVFLNDRLAARGSGQRQGLIDIGDQEANPLQPGHLRNGENSLTLVNEFDPARTDLFALNWFEVTYPRLYRAGEGWLEFTIPPDYPPGLFQFTIDGFTGEDVEIFKLGVSKITGAELFTATGSDGLRSVNLRFADTVPSRQTRYVAVAPAAKRAPLRLEVVPRQWQPSANSGIDYLVIAPRRFLTGGALTTLLRHRQGAGQQPLAVAVEDISNFFGEGRRSPLAIKAFLKWAIQRWPLQYLLLAGDGSWQRRPVDGDTLDLVPVYLRQTLKHGAAASDFWYSLLEGADEIPDLYVGRIPARSEKQLQVVVDKIIAHETAAAGDAWHNRLLFIGGNGSEFRVKGSALADKAPAAWSTSRLFTVRDGQLAEDPWFGSTPELLDQIDRGCAVINFHGHGGGAIWSDNGLLRLEDVAAMRNKGRYPLVLSMTCYTGAFEEPQAESLCETMLFAPEKGTMAFFGASGFGWLNNDDLLQGAIMEYLYEHPQASVGELLTAGKIRYYARTFGHDIARSEMSQYSLLGDPATRLRLPAASASIVLAKNLLNAGDTLRAGIQWPFASGKGAAELVSREGMVLEDRELEITGAAMNLSWPLPQTWPGGDGLLRLHGADALGLEQAHGAATFSLDRALFDSLRVIPDRGDSLFLTVRLTSRSSPAAVYCLYRGLIAPMQPLADGWYSLKIKSWNVPLSCYFRADFDDGGSQLSRSYLYNPQGIISLEAQTDRLYWGGDEEPLLHLPLLNWGDGSGRVAIRMECWESGSGAWRPAGQDTVEVTAYSSATAIFPLRAGVQQLSLRFLIAGTQGVEYEARAQVWPGAFALDPERGFLLADAGTDTLRLDSRTRLTAVSGSMREKCLLRTSRLPAAVPLEQPDFAAAPSLPVWSFEFAKTGAAGQGLRFSWQGAGADSLPGALENGALFRLIPATGKWLRLPATASGTEISAMITESGRYTVLWAADSRPPRLELTLDGRPWAANGFVNRAARATLLFHDQNGIDISPDAMQVLLDGEILAPEQQSLPDSIADGNLVPLTLQLELQPGQHRLTIAAGDCNGNRMALTEYGFVVAADFRLALLGTYPNPFVRQTTFAYSLTSAADRLSLRIYTASGRLIRELDGREGEDPNPLSADYHEIVWDGTDEEGVEVANGLYFYRLTAHRAGKSEEKSGKIARIR